jgi:hypothetical protein
MAQFFPITGTGQSLTLTWASLASDANLLVGRQSAQLTCDWDDYLVSFWVRAAATGTLTAGRQVQLWAVPSRDTTGTYPSPIVGTGDAAATWGSADLISAGAMLINAMATNATNNQIYTSRPVSLKRQLNVEVLPPKVVFWGVHSMGQPLGATGSDHGLYVLPISTEIR